MRTDRLVSIIMILLEQERVGAQALADLFEVSPRTIYRDIDAINLAGIPVCSIPGVGGGFEIMRQYKLDKKVFSASELSALLMGLSALSGLAQGDEVVHVLAKVKSLIPADSANAIARNANQISISSSPWISPNDTQPDWERIKTALQESRLLTFSYVAHRGTKTTRTAEPYQLLLKSGHWYLHGYCHKRMAFRLFRLSRMSNLEIQAETFTPRDYQKPTLDFSELLAPMQTDIKLRIHSSVMDRVLDHCPYERFSADGDEHYLVSFPFIENEFYYDILLSFGAKCECLAPPHIRAEMKRKIQAIAALYA